jgi:hypothetical protein
MADTNAIDQWLYATLTGDGALAAVVGTKVYADLPPQTEPPVSLPFVVFTMLSGVDLRVVGTYRVWANCTYKIVGMAEANSFAGNLKTMADRIDAVLDAKQGSNVTGIIYSCVREMPIRLTEPPQDGRVIRQLGGIFRIQARAA